MATVIADGPPGSVNVTVAATPERQAGHPQFTVVLSGLLNGESYNITAFATNAIGDSALSHEELLAVPGK